LCTPAGLDRVQHVVSGGDVEVRVGRADRRQRLRVVVRVDQRAGKALDCGALHV
jgi:hypothetical protein